MTALANYKRVVRYSFLTHFHLTDVHRPVDPPAAQSGLGLYGGRAARLPQITGPGRAAGRGVQAACALSSKKSPAT